VGVIMGGIPFGYVGEGAYKPVSMWGL